MRTGWLGLKQIRWDGDLRITLSGYSYPLFWRSHFVLKVS